MPDFAGEHDLTVSMKEVAKGFTIVVTTTGAKVFDLRLKVARYLIKLAAFIAGTKFRVEGEGD